MACLKTITSVLLLLHLCLIQETTGCDERVRVQSGRTLQVVSPDYPEDTPRRMHCFFDLRSRFNSGDVIHVRVLDVSLSCDDMENSLLVFDAFSSSAQYLGRVCKGGNQTFASPRDRLYLVYQTGQVAGGSFTPPTTDVASQSSTSVDISQKDGKKGRAFKLEVKAVPEFSQCYGYQAKILAAEPEAQHFVTPYFPLEVASNVHCRWLIKAPPDKLIELQILEAGMRGSNHCQNFGLYIYDGKTTYDDKNVGVICDNQSDSEMTRHYRSSGSFLLVVFSSNSHVLHTGGGVKLQYSSIALDPQTEQNYGLLYTLVGIFVALACFTAVLTVLRFVIIPARQKKSARRLDILAMQRSAGIGEPPPPYTANDNIAQTQTIEDLYNSPFPFPVSSPAGLSSQFPWRQETETSTSRRVEAASFSHHTSGNTLDAMIREYRAAVANDYQELPFLATCRANGNGCGISDEVVHGRDSDFVLANGDDRDGEEDGGIYREGESYRPQGNTEERTLSAVEEMGSNERLSEENYGEDVQGSTGLTRNRLLVPQNHRARFSSDSGFTEGEEDSDARSNVEEGLEDSVYDQLSEFGSTASCLSTSSEYPKHSYADTFSPGSLRSKLELGITSSGATSGKRFPHDINGEESGDDLSSAVPELKYTEFENVEELEESRGKGKRREEQTLEEEMKVQQKEQDEDDDVDNDKLDSDDQKKQRPLSQTKSSHEHRHGQGCLEETENSILDTASLPPRATRKAEPTQDENGYEIALPLIRAKFIQPLDSPAGGPEIPIASQNNEPRAEENAAKTHNDAGNRVLRDYDHLAMDQVGVEDVEYQVLDIGEV